MYKKIKGVLGVAFIACIIGAVGIYVLQGESKGQRIEGKSVSEVEQKSAVTPAQEIVSNGIKVVIDPGHGGYDPGKIGINDAKEKHINLAIGLILRNKLVSEGYEVVMTRDTDINMKENGSDLGKVQDLDARVQVINESEAQLAVSIHQNSYTTSDVKGAQVFYFEHSIEGEAMAAVMQEALREIDTDNHRQIKANASYYLLKRTTVPTIIVECGFLSNMEEATKLCDESYQAEMADAIIVGIEKYLETQ